MKKFLSLFLIASLWTNAFAQGDPAPYIKGSGQSGLGNIGSTVIVPNQQSTKINSYQARIETGNDNLLSNPSFESNVSGAGWTAVNGACVASSGVTVDGITNCLFTSSGTNWSLTQNSTHNAGRLTGQEMEGSIWVGSASTTDPIWLCPYVDGVALTASVANGCMQYTNIGKPQLLKVYFLGGTTSNGIRVSGANSATAVGLDAAYAGLRTNSEVSGELNTPWVPCTFSSLAWQGLGTVSNLLECKRSGPTLKIRGSFTAGTVSANIAQMPLPTNYGNITTSSTVVGGQTYGTLFRAVAANASFINTVASPSVGYINFSGNVVSGAVNPAIAVNGNGFIGTGEAALITGELTIPINEWRNNINAFSLKCDDPRQCETVFSASVSNTGSISAESLDFISGNASLSTATFTGTWTSGVFTLAPNCTASISNTVGTTTNNLSIPISTTASGFTVNTVNNQTASAQPFIIVCQKRGADYDNSRITQQIVQMREVPRTPGAVRTDIFGFSYGATSTTACTTGTCAYLAQTGGNTNGSILKVDWIGTGTYTATAKKTYTYLSCDPTASVPGLGGGSTDSISCTNCSTFYIVTRTSSNNATTNTIGNVNCIGEY